MRHSSAFGLAVTALFFATRCFAGEAPTKQFSFSDFPLAGKENPVGQKFFGKGEVASVKATKDSVGDFTVVVIDTSKQTGGVYVRWMGFPTPAKKTAPKRVKAPAPRGYWLKVVCKVHVDEERAARIDPKTDVTISGTIESVDVQSGFDWTGHKQTGDDRMITINLSGAKIR